MKPDWWIKKMSIEQRMIEPCADRQIRDGVISYGVSSYGYDFRVSDEFKTILPGKKGLELDPKAFTESAVHAITVKDFYLLPAHAYVLARSVEYFRIPRNIITICFGKSTYARCGVVVNITPFEPEWEGFVTMAICNASVKPVRIYANEGIAQLIFLESADVCEISYADKKGKYNKQTEIQLPKI